MIVLLLAVLGTLSTYYLCMILASASMGETSVDASLFGFFSYLIMFISLCCNCYFIFKEYLH